MFVPGPLGQLLSRTVQNNEKPSRTLSEADSKELLRPYGLPLLSEQIVDTPQQAAEAATTLGYPVVIKLCGDQIAHKTERGLVRLGITSPDAAHSQAKSLLAAAVADDGNVQLLVAPMVSATRELIAGVHRDEQFGPTVMIGIGGIFAEVLGDVSFRLTPISRFDAVAMLDDLHLGEMLGEFRGEAAVDREALVELLLGLSQLANDRPDILSVDVNPLMICDGEPVAVDALVEVVSS